MTAVHGRCATLLSPSCAYVWMATANLAVDGGCVEANGGDGGSLQLCRQVRRSGDGGRYDYVSANVFDVVSVGIVTTPVQHVDLSSTSTLCPAAVEPARLASAVVSSCGPSLEFVTLTNCHLAGVRGTDFLSIVEFQRCDLPHVHVAIKSRDCR